MSYLANAMKNSGTPIPTRAQYVSSVAGSTVPKAVAQTQPLHKDQVKNNTGGYVFQVDDIIYFQRFLFLGSEKGTYYVSQEKLSLDNIECVDRLLTAQRGEEMLSMMRKINDENRAAKMSPMLFALAYMAKLGDVDMRKKVYAHLHEFLRIPTHLFEFLGYSKVISKIKRNSVGWGRLQRQFIQKWYESKDIDHLTYQVTKYQQRNGWSHRDVFRLAHVKPETTAERKAERELLYHWIVKKDLEVTRGDVSETKTANFLKAFLALQTMTTEQVDDAVRMIFKHKFVREHIPTHLLNSRPVWEALLKDMPLGALIRNLNKLTKIGILDASDGFNTEMVQDVCQRLTNETGLEKARIHPLKLIVGMLTYSKGHGDKGSLTWTPNQKIVDALNDAYYQSFKYVSPTNKRFLIALDVSASMTWNNCIGASITPREGSACLALTLMKLEPNVMVKGFSHELVDVPISPSRRLDDNIETISRIPMGATNVSLPLRYALDKNIPVDAFVILSDNEANCGRYHPSELLRVYRQKMKIDARYINVQMTATQFSTADPQDVASLEISGFDSGMLETISDFLGWELL